MTLVDELELAKKAISEKFGELPPVALTLGSGLGALAERMEDRRELPYSEIPGFVESSVAGHRGSLIVGRIGETPCVCLSGRIHLYEGYAPRQVVFATRALAYGGVRFLLLTNAAGGINPAFRAGDVMEIVDHLNFTGKNPLMGPNEDTLGPRFPDLGDVYDAKLREKLRESATETGLQLRSGVYACMLGPSYETPAEIRMLARLGADAVGMSTVPEAIAAHHMGVRVAGLSLITNLAAGVSPEPLSHEDVTRAAGEASEKMIALVTSFLGKLHP